MTTKPRVVVLDYGSGNLRSAERAVARAGAEVTVTADRDAALAADGLVVPGVGAFAACMSGLLAVGGDEVIAKRRVAGRPTLAICVGHQVLFSAGIEHGVRAEGCAVWPGVVEQLDAERLPHMGWNTVQAGAGSRLFAGVETERFYFVHSYARPRAGAGRRTGRSPGPSTAGTGSSPRWRRGRLASTQFHPEKSGDAGARLIANWLATLG